MKNNLNKRKLVLTIVNNVAMKWNKIIISAEDVDLKENDEQFIKMNLIILLYKFVYYFIISLNILIL